MPLHSAGDVVSAIPNRNTNLFDTFIIPTGKLHDLQSHDSRQKKLTEILFSAR